MVYPAHIRMEADGTEVVQTVAQHCRGVSALCERSLSPLGLGAVGRLIGLLHDMGKATEEFSDSLARATRGENVSVGSVNHTFAAVQFLFGRYAPAGAPPMRRMVCEMLSFSTGAHHGQFDCLSPDGENGFLHRTGTTDNHYAEAEAAFLAQVADTAEIDALFGQAERELTAKLDVCKQPGLPVDEFLFNCALLCRLMLSALIDADRQDTAEFMFGHREPAFPEDLRPIWTARLGAVEERLGSFSRATPLDDARRQISDRCRALGDMPCGIYRLSAPTGGGKTLASLRAALAHAAAQGANRIVFVTPLLSVLEQNAAVLRTWIGDGSLILEHHSDAVRSRGVPSDELDPHELLIETWASPVIVTTLVQLLNTLFDGRTSCIRRMHALCGSVIVLDEVQSVPRNMLTLFNLAVNFLSGICGATVILCSATQPALDAVRHPLRGVRELAPYDPTLWAPFKRTELIDRRIPGGYTAEQLSGFALERLRENGSVLLICNKRSEARELYRLLHNADAKVFHLSNSMCMAHRIDTLRRIIDALDQGLPTVCVSTQLVEAGVDFSFGCVIRVFAGLDNADQSCGRCNRSGERGRVCPVYLVNLKGEDLSRLPEIRQAQEAFERLLATYRGDLQSDEAVSRYYRLLYASMSLGAQDYPLKKYSTTVYELLSRDQPFCARCAKGRLPTGVFQAFRTAGDEFRVFDDSTTDVLVQYQDGQDVIAALCSQRARRDPAFCRKWLDGGKRYTVSLFSYQLRALQISGAIYPICDGDGVFALALQPSAYDENTGIRFEKAQNELLAI